jgi:hypothetical protein
MLLEETPMIDRFFALLPAALLFLATGTFAWASTQEVGTAERPQERALDERARYDAWLASLDADGIARDYPGAVERLRSGDPAGIRTALAMLGLSKAPGAIAHVVPMLDSTQPAVRVEAGLALERLVSSIQLARRDPARPDAIVLRPRLPGQPDLTPLRWLVRHLCKDSDDGSIPAYAATMAARLELVDLGPELAGLLKSRHPSVTNAARNALHELGIGPSAYGALEKEFDLPRPGPTSGAPTANATDAAGTDLLDQRVEAAVAEFRSGFIKGFSEASEGRKMPHIPSRVGPWWAGFTAGFEDAKRTHVFR